MKNRINLTLHRGVKAILLNSVYFFLWSCSSHNKKTTKLDNLYEHSLLSQHIRFKYCTRGRNRGDTPPQVAP